MANKIFDRDTLLDLTVNVVPLFIIAFFVVGFVVFSPFGIDPLASSIQFGLLAVPFVLLAILTYFAGKAVAGAELRDEVYLPGQASVRGAKPISETRHAEEELETETAAAAVEDVEDAADDEAETESDEGDEDVDQDVEDAEETEDVEDADETEDAEDADETEPTADSAAADDADDADADAADEKDA